MEITVKKYCKKIKKILKDIYEKVTKNKKTTIFLAAVPLLLWIIFSLRTDLNPYFVLNLDNLFSINLYLNNFMHSSWPHLRGNIIGYLVVNVFIFKLEKDFKRFRKFLLASFIILPVLGPLFFKAIMPILPILIPRLEQLRTIQGFSTIAYAFAGYLFFLILEHIETQNKGVVLPRWSKWIIFALSGLLVALVPFQQLFFSGPLIIGTNFTNVPLHIFGYLLGVVAPVVIEKLQKKNALAPGKAG